jgi:hypothetical protein
VPHGTDLQALRERQDVLGMQVRSEHQNHSLKNNSTDSGTLSSAEYIFTFCLMMPSAAHITQHQMAE